MRQVLTDNCLRHQKLFCILNDEDFDGVFGLGQNPEVHSHCFESWATFLEQCRNEHDAAAGIQKHPLQQPAPLTQLQKLCMAMSIHGLGC